MKGNIFQKLFLFFFISIKSFNTYSVTLFIGRAFEKSNLTIEYFENIEQAFELIYNGTPDINSYFIIELKTGMSHIISSSWNFDRQFNVSVIPSEENKNSEVFFKNSDSFISMNGDWTFCDILFSLANNTFLTTHLLKLNINSLITFKVKGNQLIKFILLNFKKFKSIESELLGQ